MQEGTQPNQRPPCLLAQARRRDLNTYTGSVQLGRTDGGRDTLTATQLATTLGARFSPTPQDVPAEVAGMLAA